MFSNRSFLWKSVFAFFVSLALIFTACEQPSGGGNSPRPSTPSSPSGTGGGNHKHTFSASWTGDANSHWHAATCGHSDQVSGKASHTWNEGTVTKAPTLTEEGERTFTCKVCARTRTEVIPIPNHEHTFNSAWTSDDDYHWHAATCEHTGQVSGKAHHEWDDGTVRTPVTEENDGESIYKCTVCQKEKSVSIPHLSHTHRFATTLTHDEIGQYHWYATTCGHDDVPDVIHKVQHTWNSGVVTTPATCTHAGVMTYTCTEATCGATRTEPISIIAHTEVVIPAIQATCTSKGWTAGKKCSACGTVLEAPHETEMIAHSWNSGDVTTAPTETNDGVRTFTCIVCRQTKTETIPHLIHNHNISSSWSHNGTEHWHEADCNIAEHNTDVNTHYFIDSTTRQPTCVAVGEKTSRCDVCAYTKTTDIAINQEAHNRVEIPAVQATCTTEGKTKGEKCSLCGTVLIAQQIVPAIGHTWDGGTVTKPATATAKGVMTYTCTVCGETKTVEIPQLGMSLDEAIAAINALGAGQTLDVVLGSDTTQAVFDSKNADLKTALKNCKGYVNFDMSKTDVISIGDEAFRGCTSLVSVNIPEDVTSIGDYAFRDCKSLASVELPDGITSIGMLAFRGCTSLAIVNIPDGVTNIGVQAFAGCTSLTGVNIPDGVTSIGGGAFSGTSLTGVSIPDSVTSIGGNAFSGTSLTSVSIPDSVTSIGDDTFRNCTSLASVVIGDGVTSIGSHAFSGCTSLTSVNIPDGVTSIGNYAFSSCTSLTSVVIPASVTSIVDYAFADCTSLESVDICGDFTIDFDRFSDMSIFSGCTSLTTVNIRNGVTKICKNAFYGCTSITSVNIADSVTDIENYAFYGCTSLTSLVIPNSVVTIDGAFSGCSSLTSVVIPDSVVTIDGAFSGCTSLANVKIGNSVTSIGNSTFSGCASLVSVNIPDSVTSIGIGAFSGCASLVSVNIPDNVTSIGNRAFHGCTSLTSLNIPDSVTSIGVIYRCPLLKINVSNGNQNYISQDGALYNKNMTALLAWPSASGSISIPDSVTEIGDYAFSYAALTSVDIPRVTSIGSSAFYNCTMLDTINYAMPNTTWNSSITFGSGWKEGVPAAGVTCGGWGYFKFGTGSLDHNKLYR